MDEIVIPSGVFSELREHLHGVVHDHESGYWAICPHCSNRSLRIQPFGRMLLISCRNESQPCPRTLVLRRLQSYGLKSLPVMLGNGEEIDLAPANIFILMAADAPQPIVPGLLPSNALMLLTGKSKSAKSLLAIDIADSVNSGTPIFGTLPVQRRGPAIYIGMEDAPHEIAARLLRRGITCETRGTMLVSTTRCVLSEPAGLMELYRLARNEKPVVIVVDTAREALDIRDWSNPVEIANKLRPLRDFARDCCTLILVAHNRKLAGDGGDEIFGSNALTSCVDGWLSCYRKERLPDGNLQLYLRTEGRGGLGGEFTACMDTNTYRFTAVQPAPPVSREERIALDAIRAIDEDSVTAEILMSRLGISRRSAYNRLKDLVERGWLEQLPAQTAKHGPAMSYIVTPAGRCAVCNV